MAVAWLSSLPTVHLRVHGQVMALSDSSKKSIAQPGYMGDELLRLWKANPNHGYNIYDHRTFAWYVWRVESDLQSYHVDKYSNAVSNKRGRLTRWANETLEFMHIVYDEGAYVPSSYWLTEAFETLEPFLEEHTQLLPIFHDALTAYLRDSRKALHHFPSKNLVPSTKNLGTERVQVVARVDDLVKAWIAEAAAEQGQSQSKWIEAAILNQLKSQSLDKLLLMPKAWQLDLLARAKKGYRASRPRTDLSRNASVNRIGQAVSLRMNKAVVDLIEQRRRRKTRSDWFVEAIHRSMSETPELREHHKSEPLNRTFSVTLSDAELGWVASCAKSNGLTRSELLRRLARWHLR